MLAVVLWPATAGDGKPKTQCLSNLKQVGMTFALYSADSDDRLPLARMWIDDTSPYVKNDALYTCPALMPGEYGYAMASRWSGKKFTELPPDRQAVEPLLFETDPLERNAAGTLAIQIEKPRHFNYRTVVFLDFHAKAQ